MSEKQSQHEEQDAAITAGANPTFWFDAEGKEALQPLRQDLETDVVIVGGGLAGVSVAYCLLREGKRVVLVEDGYIGSGETGRTTAHLTTALDDRYADYERMFGVEHTRLIADSHKAAIDFIEMTVELEHIDCEFERLDGYLFRHPTDVANALEKEQPAALKAGICVEMVPRVPGLVPDKKGLRFPHQAQFHPLRYLRGLCDVIRLRGGEIYTGTRAETITHEGIVTADGFTVKAAHIVVATNMPVNNTVSMMLKQHAYRSYVIGALVEKDSLQKALWWDTGDKGSDPAVPPYHYARLHSYNDEYDLLISGGEDHPTGDTSHTNVPEEDRYALLETWTRSHFPIKDVLYRWSGQVMEPIDGLAYIGRNPFDHDNVYIVTGDAGDGMTSCTIAGMLLTDLIHGKPNKWEHLYKPSRFTFKESGPLFKQVVRQIVAYLKSVPHLKSAEELAGIGVGEGKVVNLQGEKVGVYRDEDEQLHIVSAICTHLKCTVAWNGDEKSWDCPCHGSRFNFKGEVLNGPANSNLPAYSENGEPEEEEVNSYQ